jgi:hypothetical protein
MATPDKTPKKVVAARRVFDVAKPGDTAPDDTSRPVIVGHKSILQDPMVTKTDEGNDEAPKAEPTAAVTSTHTAKIVAPLSEADKPPVEPEKPAEVPVKPIEVEEKSEDSNSESDDSAVVDAVVEQAGNKAKKIEEEAAAKRAKELEEIIASKKFFVPISTPKQKRNALAVVMMLVVIFAGLGAVAAADAGLINLGFNLPFDLIK